jgi:hypothetical protein
MNLPELVKFEQFGCTRPEERKDRCAVGVTGELSGAPTIQTAPVEWQHRQQIHRRYLGAGKTAFKHQPNDRGFAHWTLAALSNNSFLLHFRHPLSGCC